MNVSITFLEDQLASHAKPRTLHLYFLFPLACALLGLWGPEARAQTISEVTLIPERLQEGNVEQDGDPEQKIEVRFTLRSSRRRSPWRRC